MAFTVTESIEIDRPREDVWDYVIAHDEWRRPDVVQVRQLTDGPPGVGTRYEDTVRMMGREMTVVNEVNGFDPPGRIAWTQAGQEGPVRTIEGSYELGPSNGGTRFTLRGTYEAGGLMKLLVPLVRGRLQNKTYPTFLRQLKEILER